MMEPHHNDVLCGRGGDVNEHPGNLQMRGYCAEVVEDYKTATKKNEKKNIAQGVVDRIRSLEPAGRFLKRDANGAWKDIGDAKACKKVCAALRDSVPDKQEWQESGCEQGVMSSEGEAEALTSVEGVENGIYQGNGNDSVSQSVEVPGISLLASTSGRAVKHELPSSLEYSSFDVVNVMNRVSPTMLKQEPFNVKQDTLVQCGVEDVMDAAKQIVQQDDNLFTSIFGEDLIGPTFTDEDERREKAEMTEEEKMQVLCDIFGEYCEITQQRKRVAREPSFKPKLCLASLLREMRSEIDAIPETKKVALVEAMEKSLCNVLDDDKMELFLVREDMNAKLAAHRFVRYWTQRRALFGPAKFHLEMTQSGALRDDKVALEAGVFSILSQHDASGRPILYYAPHRNTRDGFCRASLLRATWYVFESILEDPSARNGVIFLSCWKNATLWEYDRLFEQGYFSMERLFLPMKFLALHALGCHNLIFCFAKPIAFALMCKENRARTIVRAHVDEAAVQDLEQYGIGRDVIPADMGGDCQCNHQEWLAKRRLASK